MPLHISKFQFRKKRIPFPHSTLAKNHMFGGQPLPHNGSGTGPNIVGINGCLNQHAVGFKILATCRQKQGGINAVYARHFKLRIAWVAYM
jgi:hypothetical protein